MIGEFETNNGHIAAKWGDAHKYSPAPRHRRKMILNIMKSLEYKSCLDVGCGQAYLLEALRGKGKDLCGYDISSEVIEQNRSEFPNVRFDEVDISRQSSSEGRQADVVVASEVLEHIEDWSGAVKNLCNMTKRYLLITVPSGKVHKIDKIVGHVRHFLGEEIEEELMRNGFRVTSIKRWGFPFHTIYKHLINWIPCDKVYEEFGSKKYGFVKRVTSEVIYCLFFLNNLFKNGNQLLLLGEKGKAGEE